MFLPSGFNQMQCSPVWNYIYSYAQHHWCLLLFPSIEKQILAPFDKHGALHRSSEHSEKSSVIWADELKSFPCVHPLAMHRMYNLQHYMEACSLIAHNLILVLPYSLKAFQSLISWENPSTSFTTQLRINVFINDVHGTHPRCFSSCRTQRSL